MGPPAHHHRPRRTAAGPLLVALLVVALGACAHDPVGPVQARLDALLPADAILIGEQHDAPAHQQLQRALVESLAQRGQLSALVLEMAERGTSTAPLAGDATPEQVQQALRWNTAGWPWDRYAPVVMAAVRQGVPVLGANLPRTAMREAMSDAALDRHLMPSALDRQREAIRLGHCDLLPGERLMPMVRVQLARDASMAAAVRDAVSPGKVVVLVAGGGHVLRDRGVPTHLPTSLRVRTVLAVAGAPSAEAALASDLVWQTPALAPRDHCAELARQLKR
ncbi:ChaN family lipoprotein [Comamonadaceae bacterium G21597-S1]|nr:ChaN family lipoprotein [Comamonadaceae bacterium G21597-S1]